jgi:non-ribosomal peptide synthetase component F
MHTHRSGLSFAEWAVATYELTAADRVSNHAPLHFDLSTFDFFATGIAGGTIVVIPEALTKFPANLSKLIATERISVWYSVPFALIQLMERGELHDQDTSSLRWILFAGEVFPTKHLRQLMSMLPGVRFSNLYGPTETNVCTFYHVDQLPDDTDETIPIGKACTNIEDLVVDAQDHPVSPGEVGELLIRGGVVMKGYWVYPSERRLAFTAARHSTSLKICFTAQGIWSSSMQTAITATWGARTARLKHVATGWSWTKLRSHCCQMSPCTKPRPTLCQMVRGAI